jgi:AcrR family transcriptional regulator
VSAQSRSHYHHGDLRRALLEAAEQLIREVGPDAASLRAIARAAGVSHAAPYHHFADLEDLLAAVAASGFVRLREAMLERAATGDDPAPLRRLQEAGIAYVGFAAANPELYRLMFSGRARGSRVHPELAEASDAAYEALGGLLARTTGRKPVGNGGDGGGGEAARASWALVHGLSMLLIDGRLDVDTGDARQVERLAWEVTTVIGRGLQSMR